MTPASLFPDVRTALRHRWTTLTEGLPGSFWALMAGTFVTRLGTFIVPLLFAYLTQFRHLGLSAAGRVAALYGLGSLLGTWAGGSLADHLGRRATMLGSLVAGALCMLGLGVVSEVWALAVMAFATGLASDAFRPASQALVADVVPREHRMKAFGLQYWAINLGFACSSLIGGYMATRSFTFLFVADAGTTLALAAIVWRLVPESRPETDAGQDEPRASAWLPFLDPSFAPFLALNFLVSLIFFQHLTGLIEDMRLKGLSTEEFGVAVAFNGLLIVLLQPAVTHRVAGISRAKILAVAATLTGVGFGLTTLAHTLPAYVGTVAVWTLGEILFSPVNASIVADAAPTHARGRYQGAYMLTWSAAAVASPALGPMVMDAVGMPTYWLLCLALGLVAAVGHLTITARVLRPKV